MSISHRSGPADATTTGQVLRGSLIMVAARWTMRLIGLVSTLVLARLLTPADFGVIGVAMIVIGFIEAVAERGQGLALIRLHEPTPEHFDTAWTLQILIGAGLTALIALCAPLVASAMDDSRLLPVMLALSLRSLLNGFINVGMATNRMNFRFEQDFIFICTQKLASVAVCIGLAFAFRSYWALAVAMVADRVVAVVLSYALHPCRPRLSLARLHEMWPFSGWLLVADCGDFLSRQVDAIAVAATAPGAVLGQYRVAAELSTMPTYALSLPVAYASFPAYSKLTTEPGRLRRSSLEGLAVVAALALPAGVGIFCVAEDMVAGVLGPQWTEAAPYVRWLALAGVLMALRINLTTVVTVAGRARLAAKLGWLDLAALAGGCLAVLPSGDPEHVAIARLTALGALTPLYLAAYRGATGATWAELALVLWRPAAAALAMAAAVGAGHRLGLDAGALRLGVDVAIGVAGYGLATLVLWRLAGCPPGLERTLGDRLRRRAIPEVKEQLP